MGEGSLVEAVEVDGTREEEELEGGIVESSSHFEAKKGEASGSLRS